MLYLLHFRITLTFDQQTEQNNPKCLYNSICITSLNVNGLQSKLDLGIIDVYLASKHVIILTETLTDEPDLKDTLLQDYKSINLPKLGTNRYGGFLGINILVKNDIFDHISVVTNTKSQSILWIKLDKCVYGHECIIGAMYLPHEGSKYHSDAIFENLQDDILMIKRLSNKI